MIAMAVGDGGGSGGVAVERCGGGLGTRGVAGEGAGNGGVKVRV